MSITICWRPIGENTNRFQTGTSTDFAILERVFQKKLTQKDVEKLRGIAIGSGNEFYDEVADTVTKFGPIEVWGEW